jgi:hypothetical protein
VRGPLGIVVGRGCIAYRVLTDRMNLGPKNSFKEMKRGRKVLAEMRDMVFHCRHATIRRGAHILCSMSLLPPNHIWWKRVFSFSHVIARLIRHVWNIG